MDLKSQKNIAARVMKCGKTRVWFDPSRIEDISNAITARDVRALVSNGVIKELPKKGNSSFRKKKIAAQKKKGLRKKRGSRKGKLSTRASPKKMWINRVRALRKLLKEMRENGDIEVKNYRNLYRQASGGFFHSKAHLKIHLERTGLIEKKGDKK